MTDTPLDPLVGSPVFWVVGGLVVLALLWLLFSFLARSDRGRGPSEGGTAGEASGPSGAAWVQKHPDADTGTDDPGAEGPPRP